MEEKEKKDKCKKCLYCGNYDAYYTKAATHFESIQKGYCYKLKKVVESGYGCGEWRSACRRYFMRKTVATRALFDILKQLSVLRQILEENVEDGECL